MMGHRLVIDGHDVVCQVSVCVLSCVPVLIHDQLTIKQRLVVGKGMFAFHGLDRKAHLHSSSLLTSCKQRTLRRDQLPLRKDNSQARINQAARHQPPIPVRYTPAGTKEAKSSV